MHYPDAEALPREQLITRPADCFFPGAQPDSIHAGNVEAIKARCLISIANIATDEQTESDLARRGIDYFPGFVANCGGILSYYLREQDFALEELEEFIRTGFAEKIRFLLARSDNAAIARTAREIAAQNGAQMIVQAPRWRKLFNPRRFGWLLYRNAGRYGLRGLLLPYARQYMRSQLFLS
jgi:glutamate dehydrogenase/leucine dehydrogenase